MDLLAEVSLKCDTKASKSSKMLDLLAEYEEVKKIPVPTAVGYKFFSNFKVADNCLLWAGFSTPLEEDAREAVKAFLKEQRRQIRDGVLSGSEISRRMWFWFQKILDLGLFTEGNTRNQILRWMEVCELILA
jgi:hypothetical protein